MITNNIIFTPDPGPDLQKFLSSKGYSSIAVLTDENTEQFCYPFLKGFLPTHITIRVKSGEKSKTLETCSTIWQRMTEVNLDRHSVLIILGGGVLGDMGGFCASTYKRGIDFIVLPTTLLAQCDASIGGKLGIDFDSFKNHIGVFKEPALNLIYTGFLKTLPKNELRSGFAEVIKHALISDQKLWEAIRSNDLNGQLWEKLVPESVKVKSAVVAQDPEEKGLRKILNAGHTVGHALESHFLETGKPILHGEAIAAGLIAETYLGVKRKMTDESALKEMESYILKIFGKIEVPENQIQAIAARCLQDKKNKGNKVLCVLPMGIGKVKYDVEISLGEIEECLAYYRLLQT